MNLANFLGIQHYFPTDGNQVYIRQMSAPAGYVIDTHQHAYEHYSILASGTVRVEIDGETTEYTGPKVIAIKANTVHKITSITDFTWFCIHHTDVDDEDKIDDVLIKKE
ncbi:cupin domain-containing protein [Methylomonas montana]|uniref:cupin domain-containing protein n=1 Tax=Methylomonas montana TaxID=3058963 RepID=UPI0026599FBB|nr:cupin domain-containing protein [Methylomonas montana]WKJ88753.1 cupin domain-containing protein [Methylomonas montana]